MKWYNNFVVNSFIGCICLAFSPVLAVVTYPLWSYFTGDIYDDTSLMAIPWLLLFTVPGSAVLFLLLLVVRVAFWAFNGKDKLL